MNTIFQFDQLSNTTVTFSCHCNATTFTIEIPTSSLPLAAHICHCSICRRTRGASLFAVNAEAPSPPRFVNGDLDTACTRYVARKHPEGVRWFCHTCGAHVLGYNMQRWYVSAAFVNSVEDGAAIASNSDLAVQKRGLGSNRPGLAEQIFKIGEHVFTHSARDGGAAGWWTRNDLGTGTIGHWNPPASMTSTLPSSDQAHVSKQEPYDTLNCHCHCGGVSLTLRRPDIATEVGPGTPLRRTGNAAKDPSKWLSYTCFCDSCRLTVGTPMVHWVAVAWNALTVPTTSGSGTTSPLPQDLVVGSSITYRSSRNVTRTFCGVCGATILYCMDTNRGKVVDLAAGLLDSSDGVRAEDWCEWKTDLRDEYVGDGKKYHRAWVERYMEGIAGWGKAL